MNQKITFALLSNVKEGNRSVALKATSDSGMPVYFYVQEGPAEVKDGKLVFTKIPPRSKFPVKVTVVAWQYGRSVEPKIKTAEPVIQSFWIGSFQNAEYRSFDIITNPGDQFCYDKI
jgi:hypothetical protein